jgi:hypothetical protein
MSTELLTRKESSSRVRALLLASAPGLYILLVLGAILTTAGYKLRTEGIFACQADRYSADEYLAYCNATGYADYEHGAFWFGFEPAATRSAAEADVMFLGDSRLEIALSTAATGDWFSAIARRYYLLGFGYGETTAFTAPLLSKIRPQAKVYVINVDPFFRPSETVPAKTVMTDGTARLHYEVKWAWQIAHRSLCGTVAALCADHYAVFRSRSTGAYHHSDFAEYKSAPVSDETIADGNAVEQLAATGRDLLSQLPVRHDCVILTAIPTVETKLGTAKAVSEALGLPWVSPQVTGLTTFDGSHLDRASAERWSKAFLDAAAPRIQSCLARE